MKAHAHGRFVAPLRSLGGGMPLYDAIMAEVEATERARAERIAGLLRAERAPRTRPSVDPDRLDATTIAALSGGTLRSLRT
jgi:hypothetical protein